MNEKIAPLLLRLKTALTAEDYGQCALLTKALFLHDVVVKWDVGSRFTLDWAEWQAGEPGSFRSSATSRVGYSTFTKPTPSRRTGNSWSGGTSSALDLPGCGHSVSVSQAAANLAAVRLAQLSA